METIYSTPVSGYCRPFVFSQFAAAALWFAGVPHALAGEEGEVQTHPPNYLTTPATSTRYHCRAWTLPSGAILAARLPHPPSSTHSIPHPSVPNIFQSLSDAWSLPCCTLPAANWRRESGSICLCFVSSSVFARPAYNDHPCPLVQHRAQLAATAPLLPRAPTATTNRTLRYAPPSTAALPLSVPEYAPNDRSEHAREGRGSDWKAADERTDLD